ncbi:MAG: PBP1A family penicillin-binding protein [Pseudomonadota bacterium]
MKQKVFLLFKYATLSFVVIFIFGALIGMGVYLQYSRNLPKIITVADYKPRAATTVFDKNGVLIGEFFRENRQIIPYSKIPPIVIQAFVASEDGKFFEHKGLDFAGIFRAMIANFKSGRFSQGGSTITQQVARSLLLTSEKKISRKVKEAILAGRIESHLKKEEILYLYLNQIFLGHNAYGVQSAAKSYFNKDVSELTIAESALLAGLPQAPSKWSPFTNPNKSKERQMYVLTRMVEDGYITKQQAEKAVNERLKLYKNEEKTIMQAPYFVEFVRRYLVSKYGDDKVLDEGLKVYTTLDINLQNVAEDSIKSGVRVMDKKLGFRGPLEHFNSDKEINAAIAEINKEIFNSGRDYIYFPEPWQDFVIKNRAFVIENKEDAKNKNLSLLPAPLDKGTNYKAVVLGYNNKAKELKVSVGFNQGVIRKEGFAWGDLFSLRKGDVVHVNIVKQGVFSVEQEPLVEGSLLSFNISDGSVAAMVGGYSYEESEFNRAYQAKRQAGSTFKPFIYSAALDKGYTAASVIVDSPIVYGNNDEEGTTWKPENYSQEFYGDTILRDAIAFSRNIPTTKILQDIKISYAIEYAQRLGIRSEMPHDLSLGLGSTSVSLWEMTKAFAVFASGGKRVTPYFIIKIEDRDGKVIEQYDVNKPYDAVLKEEEAAATPENAAPETTAPETKTPPPAAPTEASEDKKEVVIDMPSAGYVIPPQTAYIMNSLLKDAATHGTGAKAGSAINVPIAGKTGTSNDFTDAWFVGFTPNVMTGVWVGFDDQSKTLGQGQTGAEVAIPIWIPYMKEALKNIPRADFKQPEGIKLLKVDGKTGKIASKRSARILYLPFKHGTEPTKVEGEIRVDDADETQFFRENY